MQPQIFEGTVTEIQRQIALLPVKPDTRLRIVATELAQSENQTTQFESSGRRNGLILFPTKNRTQPITTEFINELLNEE